MKKLDAESPETKSADIVSGNVEVLKSLFPDAFTEGKIDFEVLKELLGGAVDEREEKYGLKWHGKRRARQIALTPSAGTLLPCPEESVDWDTTQNLMIEGDNLEVLKLLQKSYASKVKLVYIDPPYNTGGDFVYPDDFRDNISNYMMRTGQVESDGRKNSSNTESSGRFHTDWLCMIYPRLKLAWSLLQPDGFLLVSIDDRESGNLRLVLNEICGEENFIAVLVFDRNRKNDAKLVSVGHEYMMLYAKNKQLLSELDVRLRAPKDGVDELRDIFAQLRQEHGDDWAAISGGLKEHYSTFVEDDPRLPLARFTKVDERGPYRDDGDPSWPGGGGPRYDVLHPTTGKPCTVPSRGWVWPTYERMKQEIDAGNIVFGPDEKRIPSIRRNIFEKDDQVLRSVIFSYAQKASQDFAALFDGKSVFQNPKSYRDLHRLVTYLTAPGETILDFFAGSGTTGHGTMLANVEAAPSRRFIMVQLQELLDANDKDQKIAAEFCTSIGKPLNIAEITKERLRRAAKMIRSETPDCSGDLGFRVFKLAPSNIRAWEPDAIDLEDSLLKNAEHLVPGRKEQDVLYELLLKLGLDLCVPIETKTMAGKMVHSIGGGTLIASLADGLTKDVVEELANGIVEWRKALAPAVDTRVVFKDTGFADDIAKTNMAAILNQAGISEVRSL
ncbi:site-specific DNA-methyltransferase [Xanthobacter aminoxidans]|uniref:site-specific DNA-methyltransferase (adenine-specific) n=1 Tax=Xanthobacter aminoxidans TaxID=186280 RepID=A0ABW6ZHK3_9HYPH